MTGSTRVNPELELDFEFEFELRVVLVGITPQGASLPLTIDTWDKMSVKSSPRDHPSRLTEIPRRELLGDRHFDVFECVLGVWNVDPSRWFA
jgi:hypothetical protein